MKWTPDLVIALVLICICAALIATGKDGEVKSVLTLAAGWCFGSQFVRRHRNEGGKT